MGARAIALAVAALCLLAGCTPDAAPPPNPAPVGTSSSTAATTESATPSDTASAGATTRATAPASTPTTEKLIVLSGTSIGGRPLGHAELKSVDRMLVDRLGTSKTGQPQLCRADGGRATMAVIDHTWPGLTVRYGSSGAVAVAIAWTVDLDRVPEGFQLDGGLPWQPTFAALEEMPGVTTTTTGDVQHARLTRLRVTWSGPAGASRPDTVTGGADISCA
jgi:hypothetical protein